MSVEQTVFISYRRANSAHALLITEKLKDHNYDVFLDVNSLGSGAFGQTIFNQIAARAHFIVLLTPSTLERCIQPDDWIRKEVEQAIELKRNIVPIMFDGFEYGKSTEYLTGTLALLPQYNSLPVDYNYFDAVIDKLIGQFLNGPLDLVIHPTPPDEVTVVKESIESTGKLPTPTIEQLKAEHYFEQGFLKIENLDLEGAITDLSEAIRLNPKFDEAYYHRGRAYGNKRDIAKSISDWEEAVRLEPDDIRVNITRSCIYREKGDFNRSLIEADAGVSLNPKDPDAYFQRGNVKRHLKDWDGAIADYTYAIELSPKTAILYSINRAMTQRDKGNYTEAIQEWTRIIDSSPNHARAYNGRGFTNYIIGDLDNALIDCLKSVELDPNNKGSRDSLGQIYFTRGDFQASFEHFTKAYELDPTYEFALAGLGICNYTLGRSDAGVAFWRELIAKNVQYHNDPEWLREKLSWQNPLIDEARKLIAKLNN